MYLQNLKIAIIFSVIILSINSTSAVGIRKRDIDATVKNETTGNGTKINSDELTSNVESIELTGFERIRLETEYGHWCGGYFVYMEICNIENHLDKG